MRRCAVFLFLLAFLAGCAQTVSRDELARTLRENPQLIYDALSRDKGRLLALVDEAAGEREVQARLAAMRQGLAHRLKPDLSGDRPFLGPADAPVTIVEYSDLLCPYCAQASQTVAELMRRHPGMIRLYFKHLPGHPGSLEPAAVFEVLGRQDRHLAWKFAEAAFANQNILEGDPSKGIAALLAMLKADSAKDAEAPAVLARIKADMAEAQRFGVDGTPSFVVNGVLVRGAVPISDFEALFGMLGASPAQATAPSAHAPAASASVAAAHATPADK